jgi:hypothetical protein
MRSGATVYLERLVMAVHAVRVLVPRLVLREEVSARVVMTLRAGMKYLGCILQPRRNVVEII